MRNEECPLRCKPRLSLRARLDAVGADIIRPCRTHRFSVVFRRIHSALPVGAAFGRPPTSSNFRQAGDRRSPLRPPGPNVLFRRGRRPRRPARDAPIRRRWAALPTAEMKKLPNFPPEWGETVESAPFSGRFHPKKIDITVTEGAKISKLVDIITICRNFFSLFDKKLPALRQEMSKTINMHKHKI